MLLPLRVVARTHPSIEHLMTSSRQLTADLTAGAAAFESLK
jgi:hypothetical protein